MATFGLIIVSIFGFPIFLVFSILVGPFIELAHVYQWLWS